MHKIAILSAYHKSFIQRDIERLAEKNVVDYCHLPKKKFHYFMKLVKTIKKNDISIFWFADFTAFVGILVCRLINKKAVVIVGGYELAAIPELNYGGLKTKFSTWRVKWILKKANQVIFVDESLQKEAEKKLALGNNNFQVIPTGFDGKYFQAAGEKKDVILTVASVSTKEIVKLKGLDFFIEAAPYFPEMKFRIVGINGEAKSWLQAKSSENVEFIGFVNQEKLKKQYQEAKIYCQLSLREGLPNSICEAMLCECIPVGSNINGIPKAIGDTGVLWKNRDLKSLKNCLQEALQIPTGKPARERILTQFSEGKRKESLQQVIERLC
jgi:glycosyltransferase involved in cell wall biosynthesis